MFQSVNPYTEQLLNTFESHSAGHVDSILKKAGSELGSWASLRIVERLDVVSRLAQTLRSEADLVAKTATLEMGKPISQSIAEVLKCADLADFVVAAGEQALADRRVSSTWRRSLVTHEPLGVILGVMPWNFPFWQVFRFALPALAAGNAVVIKPAPTTVGTAYDILRMCRDAGFPADLVSVALTEVADTHYMIRHPSVAAVSFTGSTGAGSAIAAAAGSAVKKCVLELGGSDPYVVCADADLALAADVCARYRLANAGQSCIAAKRFIVNGAVFQDFMELFVDAFHKHSVVGNPMEESTTIGPLARRDLRDSVVSAVDRTLDKGAGIAYQYAGLPETGWFVAPTIVAGVGPGMAGFDEEVFGPVAMVYRAESDEDALRVANASVYGLGACVFTANEEKAAFFVRSIRAGLVFVNDGVRSDSRLPFGGVGMSGYGRELGMEGFMEFVNIKSVVYA